MGKLLSVILKKKQPANKQSQQQPAPPGTEFVDNFTNLASIDLNPE